MSQQTSLFDQKDFDTFDPFGNGSTNESNNNKGTTQDDPFNPGNWGSDNPFDDFGGNGNTNKKKSNNNNSDIKSNNNNNNSEHASDNPFTNSVFNSTANKDGRMRRRSQPVLSNNNAKLNDYSKKAPNHMRTTSVLDSSLDDIVGSSPKLLPNNITKQGSVTSQSSGEAVTFNYGRQSSSNATKNNAMNSNVINSNPINSTPINSDNKDDDRKNLVENLNKYHHKHMSLLLKQVIQLNSKIDKQNQEINELKNEILNKNKQIYQNTMNNRINSNNLFMLCGSHKFWKHKYNQLYTVNVATNVRTNIRITDINKNDNTINHDPGFLPTQSDWWDVGDLAVTLLLNKYKIPNWMIKKYSNLSPFITSKYNSIIFRTGGHLIRDKKVTNRCDAILFNTYNNTTSSAHGYHINCLPNLPTKRYNCESIYSEINGLVVVGGSGVDKQQIKKVDQLKLSDNDVNSTGGNDNISTSLKWKSLAGLNTPREDTALCLFSDKNNINKEYMIVCGGWSNGCLKKCELYNFNLNKWLNISDMNLKHNAAGIAGWKHKDSILICGGFNTEAHYACEYFDLIKQKWNKLPNTNYKHRYKPATWIDIDNPNIICTAGNGVLKKEVGYVEYLDTRDKEWQTLNVPLSKLMSLGDQINPNNWRMWRIFHP